MKRFVLIPTLALALLTVYVPEAYPADSSSINLIGDAAKRFDIPSDVKIAQSFYLDKYGITYERYGQYFGAAEVLGGDITVIRDGNGSVASVFGSHFRNLVPRSKSRIAEAIARRFAEQDAPDAQSRFVDLLIDPKSGRFLFRVESRGFATRWFHLVDAENGRLVNRWDALQTAQGTGVKGDIKDLDGDNSDPADDLTIFHGEPGHGAAAPHWDIFSSDGRQLTFDARNGRTQLYFATDADNLWNLTAADRKSPGHPALIDAHYYAKITDNYFLSRHGLDWIAHCGYAAMQSAVHYRSGYNNAFWDGAFLVYGDGNGIAYREFSGGIDIVAHEAAHAITQCTSRLIYQNESGALNESFSDIMGTNVEFFANESLSSNCVRAPGQTDCADWWIGEDIALKADAKPGHRNMQDPAEDASPSHWSEYKIITSDNGGIHKNSGIPNHVYYLLVNGGRNAGCARKRAHCAGDGAITVTGIGIGDAERIFFLGFALLPSNATFCNARAATENAADLLFGAASQQRASTTAAWVASGLTNTVCGVSP
ncbi:MAG: M4 family metallopeptidase [Deltaproteobacteria bacterium]